MMRKKIFFMMMAGILLTQNFCVYAEESEQTEILSEGMNQFAYNLYQEMNTEENIFFSPYSIGVALSMLDLEADTETKEQIEGILGIQDQEEWNRQLSEYMKADDREGAKIETANAMWLSNQLELAETAQEDVLNPLQDLFEAEIFQADILNENEKVLEEVNEWVSDHTEGMIDPFLEELPKETVSMLINAVYFEGKWSIPFDEELTRKDNFKGQEKDTEVDMMQQSGMFRYLETEEYQAIQIPYGDGSVAMNILLPFNQGDQTFAEWYEELEQDQDEIWKELNDAQQTDLEVVRIPKFSLEQSIPNLDQIMKILGMTEAYSSDADFSRLAQGLYLDSMVHKAKIEVSEESTKAAAATGMISRTTAIIEEEKPEFVADHPFLFVIQDTENNMILFMGQVNQL